MGVLVGRTRLAPFHEPSLDLVRGSVGKAAPEVLPHDLDRGAAELEGPSHPSQDGRIMIGLTMRSHKSSLSWI